MWNLNIKYEFICNKIKYYEILRTSQKGVLRDVVFDCFSKQYISYIATYFNLVQLHGKS